MMLINGSGCIFSDKISVLKGLRCHFHSFGNTSFLDWVACRGLRLTSLSLFTGYFGNSLSLTTRNIITNSVLTLKMTGTEIFFFSQAEKLIFVDVVNSMHNLLNLELSEVYCCDFFWSRISSHILQQLVKFDICIVRNKVILPPNFFKQIADRCGSLKKFQFCNNVLCAEFILSESKIISFVENCSKLHSLYLNCGGICTTAMLIAIHEKCKCLENLDIFLTNSSISLSACVDLISSPSIRTLFIGNKQENIDDRLFQCIQSTSKTLRITGFTDCEMSMCRLFTHIKCGIVNLRLTRCDGVNPDLIVLIANNNPTLERIVVIGLVDYKTKTKVTSSAIIHMVEKCPLLSMLVFTNFVMSEFGYVIPRYSANFDDIEFLDLVSV